MINNYENFNMVIREMFEPYKEVDMEAFDEAQKLKFGDKVVSKLANDVYKKINKNYKIVDSTRGDFKKLSNYKEIGKAINFLKKDSDSKHSAELKRRADVLDEAYKMIVSHKDVFTAGYEFGNDMLIMTYNSIGVGIVKGVSEAISMYVNMNDDYKMGNKEYKSSSINALQDLNRLAASGKIRRMGDNLIARKEEVVTALGMGVVAIVILILKNMKVLVYNYYNSRVELADHIRNIQEYVNCKSDRTMDKSVKAKQERWSERLGALADKIDIDARQSEEKAQKSIVSSDAALADMPTDWLF